MEELEKKALQAKIKEEEELFNYAGDDRMIASTDLKVEIDARPTSNFKLMTQFSALNSAFDGFKLGNLVIIAGHTNHGKTEFGMDLAQHFIKEGNNVAWFNFETSQQTVLKRFERKCGEMPIFYLPREKKNSFKWFKQRIRESILKYDPKVVFIDNLRELTQMDDLDTPNLSANYSVYVGAVVQKIADIAIENNIIIFMMVDPRAADETQSLSRRDVGRDSSLITSIPDAILTIWQECKQHREGVDYTGNTWLNILKNREFGEKGKIKLKFENWKFYETM